jgi:hypothetical protein
MRTFVQGVRTLVLICLFSSCSIISLAQSLTTGNGKFEIGMGIGPMFFLGDLGGHRGEGKTFLKDLNLPLTKISKGLYANVYPAEWIGFRVAVNQGKLEGYDSLIVDKGGGEGFRKDRNLQFRSDVWEAYGAVEFYPTVFMERFDGLFGKFRPYGLIGYGIFHFNPQGKYYAPDGTSKWVDLQPLRLEGQGMAEYPDRKPYKLTQVETPMGVGLKYYIKENMYVGFEVLHRKTYTDYVDDVSLEYIDPALFAKYLTPEQAAMAVQLHNRQGFDPSNPNLSRFPSDPQRGNPKQNDAFFSTLLRFGWRLNDWNSTGGRAAKQMRCPLFY